MLGIKPLLSDFRRSKNFQDFINRRFKDDSKIVLNKNICNIINTIETKHGNKFIFDDLISSIEDVENDYYIYDLKASDIVMDIGSCIGAFALKICRHVSRVYAIEPVMTERLRQNVNLNNIKNIIVIDAALGDKDMVVSCNGRHKQIKARSFSDIVSLCGGHIDFLKMDCEGGEWCIRPEDLEGIRRIEAEVHNPDGKHDVKKFLQMLDSAGFKYKHDLISKETMLVHANREQ